MGGPRCFHPAMNRAVYVVWTETYWTAVCTDGTYRTCRGKNSSFLQLQEVGSFHTCERKPGRLGYVYRKVNGRHMSKSCEKL